MATRTLNKLSARTVDTKRNAGLYGDGGGLCLQIGPTGSKSWLFRFMLKGKAREMGLGSVRDVTLTDARDKAATCRRALRAGIDPIKARDNEAVQRGLAAVRTKTFKECADEYIESHRAGWGNAKHAEQWKTSLGTYAYPVIGEVSVQDVDTDLVLKILTPVWATKTETASRVRGRIEVVLDAARARGIRTGENPARWRGHLDKLLPRRSKVQQVVHHPALPFSRIPAFMVQLREQEGVAARALEWTILNAARTSETIAAHDAELDLAANVWTIPASRMKSKRSHRAPLSDRAATIAREMIKLDAGGLLFPGPQRGKRLKPLSTGGMTALLKRMGRGDLTVHGFRSTFRDWAGEQTNFPREVAEAALAHVISDKVEAAYRRGDFFMKRRQLMDAWSAYCQSGQTARIVRARAVAAV